MEQSSLCPYSTARIDSSSSRDYWVKEHAILLRRRTNHPLFHMTSFTSYKGERQEPLLAPVPANTGCSYDICISKAQDPITCSIFSLEGTHPLLIVYEPSVPPRNVLISLSQALYLLQPLVSFYIVAEQSRH